MAKTQDAITKINKYATTIAIIAGFVSAIFAFYAAQAIGEHNEKKAAHPAIAADVAKNTASINLLGQKADLIQKANDKAHNQQEKNQGEMIKMLGKLTDKIDAL